MRISSDSKLIRYAYIFQQDWEIPEHTTLCRLFWRTVFITTVFLFLLSLAAGYISLWVVDPGPTAAATVTFIVIVAGMIVGDRYKAYRSRKRLAQENEPPAPPSILKETLYAVKNRICPIIYIADEADVPVIYIECEPDAPAEVRE